MTTSMQVPPLSCMLAMLCFACVCHAIPTGSKDQRVLESCPTDIVFVLDGSGSVTATNWIKMLDYVVAFAHSILLGEDSTRMGVVTFGNKAHINIKLNSIYDITDFRNAVLEIPYLDENTNTSGALWLTRTEFFKESNGDRSDYTNLLILITDGLPTYDVNRTVPEALQAAEDDITIYTVAIGDEPDHSLMLEIANDETANVFYATDFEALTITLVQVLGRYCPTLDIMPTYPPGITTTPSRTWSQRNSIYVDCIADLAFVLDGSGSVTSTNWDLTLNYVTELTNSLNIGYGKTQVGVISFGNEAHLNIKLNQFDNMNEFGQAVVDIPYLDENTNTSGAIKLARTQLFTADNGDRPDVPNIMILLTDGKPTYDANETVPQADLSRQDNIEIISIGVTNEVNADMLYMIANNRSDRVFTAVNYTTLDNIRQMLLEAYCSASESTTTPITTPTTPAPTTTTVPITFHDVPVETKECNANIAFVLDGSGSVTSDNWDVMLDFVYEFAIRINQDFVNSRIGVVTYGNDASVELAFSQGELTDSNMQYLHNHITNISYRDANTNIAAGIRKARHGLFQTSNRISYWKDIMVIVTDGVPTYEVDQTLPQADLARDENIEVITVGIGSQIDEQQLFMIAGNMTDRTYTVGNFTLLKNKVSAIANGACQEATTLAPKTTTTTTTTTMSPSTTPTILHDAMECNADVGFVLDGSGSVTIQKWNVVLKFVYEFASKLSQDFINSRIGVVTYGNEASVELFFTEGELIYYNMDYLKNHIMKIAYRDQNTNTASGIRKARQELFHSSNRMSMYKDIMIIVTDGVSTMEVDQTLPEAQLSREEDIEIITVGVGNEIDEQQLFMIAGNNSEFTYQVNDFDGLLTEINTLVSSACRARDNEGCDLDLVFVLDASGSIDDLNFARSKEFLKHFIDSIPDNDVGSRVQIALVSFSSTATVQFLLNTYSTADELKAAVDAVPPVNQRTNIAHALQLARTEVLQEQFGDRPNVQNLVILISDGNDNQEIAQTTVQANLLKEQESKIMTIGAGKDSNMQRLQEISSLPYSHYVRLYKDMFDLIDDTELLFQDLCLSVMNPPAPLKVDINNNKYSGSVAFVLMQSDEVQYPSMHTYVQERLADWGSRTQYTFSIHRGYQNFIDGGMFSGSVGADAVVLVTDYLDESGASQLRQASLQMQEQGIEVFLITAGYQEAIILNGWYMEDIASLLPEQHMFNVSTFYQVIESEAEYLYWTTLEMFAMGQASEIWSCDFEDGMGETTWCDMRQASDDEFDWTLHSNQTGSTKTGPEAAFNGQYYIYIETSSPRQPRDEAELFLPSIESVAGERCLQFLYNMYGYHTGSLQVVVISSLDNREKIMWSLHGPQGTGWHLGAVNVELSVEHMVFFRGIRAQGHTGDIALDSIRILDEPCVLTIPNNIYS